MTRYIAAAIGAVCLVVAVILIATSSGSSRYPCETPGCPPRSAPTHQGSAK